jgi:hypothetical protein
MKQLTRSNRLGTGKSIRTADSKTLLSKRGNPQQKRRTERRMGNWKTQIPSRGVSYRRLSAHGLTGAGEQRLSKTVEPRHTLRTCLAMERPKARLKS